MKIRGRNARRTLQDPEVSSMQGSFPYFNLSNINSSLILFLSVNFTHYSKLLIICRIGWHGSAKNQFRIMAKNESLKHRYVQINLCSWAVIRFLNYFILSSKSWIEKHKLTLTIYVNRVCMIPATIERG